MFITALYWFSDDGDQGENDDEGKDADDNFIKRIELIYGLYNLVRILERHN